VRFARKNLKVLEEVAFPAPIKGRGPSALVKLCIILSGILAGSLIHSKLSLLLLLILALSLALAWGARPKAILKRLGPPILLFGVLLPLPALVFPFAPAQPISLWIIKINPAGLSSAITLSLRATCAVTFAGAGFLTEEPLRLLSALFLPRELKEVVLIAYRYTALIAKEAWEMFLGKLARDPSDNLRSNISFLGSRVGLLFARSAETGEKVYLAMRARGYPGAGRRITQWSPRVSDLAWPCVKFQNSRSPERGVMFHNSDHRRPSS